MNLRIPTGNMAASDRFFCFLLAVMCPWLRKKNTPCRRCICAGFASVKWEQCGSVYTCPYVKAARRFNLADASKYVPIPCVASSLGVRVLGARAAACSPSCRSNCPLQGERKMRDGTQTARRVCSARSLVVRRTHTLLMAAYSVRGLPTSIF